MIIKAYMLIDKIALPFLEQRTALYEASSCGHADLVEWLVGHEASIALGDDHGVRRRRGNNTSSRGRSMSTGHLKVVRVAE